MPDPSELRDDRDKALVRQLCSSARNLRLEYREWIRSEVKACLPLIEAVEILSNGSVKVELQFVIVRMRDIESAVLNEAVASLDEKIDDIHEGGYDNLPDARAHLEEGLSRLESMVRELLKIRAMVEDQEE